MTPRTPPCIWLSLLEAVPERNKVLGAKSMAKWGSTWHKFGGSDGQEQTQGVLEFAAIAADSNLLS